MRNFFQALKLQISSTLVFYLLNLLFVILATVLIYFFKNSFALYVSIIVWCFISSFILGNITYKIGGKTYYALKHDRRYFVSGSVFHNFLNAIIMTVVYLGIIRIDGYYINILSIIYLFIHHLACYSIGVFYSLYISKLKVLKILLGIIIIVFTLLLMYILVFVLADTYLVYTLDKIVLELRHEYIYTLIGIISFILFNILNKHKYLK